MKWGGGGVGWGKRWCGLSAEKRQMFFFLVFFSLLFSFSFFFLPSFSLSNRSLSLSISLSDETSGRKRKGEGKGASFQSIYSCCENCVNFCRLALFFSPAATPWKEKKNRISHSHSLLRREKTYSKQTQNKTLFISPLSLSRSLSRQKNRKKKREEKEKKKKGKGKKQETSPPAHHLSPSFTPRRRRRADPAA